ncbi:MAG: ATP-binding protein [Desulfobacterales bacterium]
MTLKKKILTGYGVAFALMGLVVVWAVMNLVSLGRAGDAILRENYRSILAAENMVNALERQDSGILLLFLGDAGTGIAQFRENEAVFLEWMARARDNITIEGEAKLVQSIEKDYATFRHQFSALTDVRDTEKQPLPLSISTYRQRIHPLFVSVRKTCAGLRHLNEETMYAASVRAGRVAQRAIWSTVLVALSALAVALIFSLLLAERIVQPLRGLMEASRKISAGDYAVQIPVQTGDELGLLACEFNEMATRLGHYHKMNIEQILSEKNKGEAILASIEDGLLVFDTDLKTVGINPAARSILHLNFAETAGLNSADILPPFPVCEIMRKTVENGKQPDIPDEQRILTLSKGDESRHYLFSVTVIRGKDQSLSGIVLLLRDITRLKEVERLKTDFVMAASHELRTPLTSLGMSVDLLLEHAASKLAEKDQELLQTAHEEVLRMKALISDLLDLSRIEAGRIELDFEKVPVQTLFDHAQDVFKSQAEMKEVSLGSEKIGDVPPVRADANKVTWVLTNLISNALRYVKKGGSIRLMAKQAGTCVHLSVKDDGQGIPLEYQSKIFHKFVQVKGQESGGTGLGLAICKEIVRAHGGTIWLESSPDKGSTFTFTLPAAQ